jgi:hypothetical protein
MTLRAEAKSPPCSPRALAPLPLGAAGLRTDSPTDHAACHNATTLGNLTVGAAAGPTSPFATTLVAAVRLGLTGRKAKVSLPGGDLVIEWREHDGHVIMTGPVEMEFEGQFDPALFSGLSA